MSLRFDWEWESAPEVRTPELRATWSSLQIDLGDITATLVEDRDRKRGIRRRINVPTYPLAEFIAYNWWRIVSPTPSNARAFRFADAGDGFPWPDLKLSTGAGFMVAQLDRLDCEPMAVRFLSSGESLLVPDDAERELRRFVEDTIQQLQATGVEGTPLQEEWAAVSSADDEVADFCQVASSLGFDPYDMDPRDVITVEELGGDGIDAGLLAQFGATIGPDGVREGRRWLLAALHEVDPGSAPHVALPFEPLRFDSWQRPWEAGYTRARRARAALGLGLGDQVDVDLLALMTDVEAPSPHGMYGMSQSDDDGTGVALASGLSDTARRFAVARALGHQTFDRSGRAVLLSDSVDYSAKVERAFAAEFLAPAEGIRAEVGRAPSEALVVNAAARYRVNPLVVAHQIENQLGISIS